MDNHCSYIWGLGNITDPRGRADCAVKAKGKGEHSKTHGDETALGIRGGATDPLRARAAGPNFCLK